MGGSRAGASRRPMNTPGLAFPGDPILATGGVGNLLSTVVFHGPILKSLVTSGNPPPKEPARHLSFHAQRPLTA